MDSVFADSQEGQAMRIAGAGCCLIDSIYMHCSYTDEAFKKLWTKRRGDGGLIEGGLVFSEDLQQFAYVASHDLQEPLRSVVGYLQFIERLYADKLDDKGKDFIDRAVAATTRMRNMIQDLLTFSQVATRGKPFARCNPAEILADTLESLKFSIESKAAFVTVGKLPEVVADRSQLKQLFQNLIGNALKFCDKEHPAIDIFCNEHDGKAVFMVRDNGIGIESEYREKIFEIFQRLHGRNFYEGTGIGLAVCKKIVERHRGKIWVESVPGEGSTFCFTLGAAMEYSRQGSMDSGKPQHPDAGRNDDGGRVS